MVSLLSICFRCFRTIDKGLRLNTKLVKVCTTLKHINKVVYQYTSNRQEGVTSGVYAVSESATAVRLYELLRRCGSTSDTPPFTGTLAKVNVNLQIHNVRTV